MKTIFLLTQCDREGYDTYDSCIVAADSEYEARNMHPNDNWNSHSWACSPESVIVEAIGVAKPSIKASSILLASFNAG